MSWQPGDPSLPRGIGNKRNTTQEREKTDRIAQREREIIGEERGIMGSRNEGTINTQPHSYNRHQSDPPRELHKLVINSISGPNEKT